MSDSPSKTLLEAAQASAKRDLFALAKRGVSSFFSEQHDYSTAIFDSHTANGDEDYFTLFPADLVGDNGIVTSGILNGFRAPELLAACFSPAAFELILRQSSNKYCFWSQIKTVANAAITSAKAVVPLPFDLSFVQTCLSRPAAPFGVASSKKSQLYVATLKSAIALSGGFDINKLEPKLVVLLLKHQVIYQRKVLGATAQIPELVVNPLWADWFATLSAE